MSEPVLVRCSQEVFQEFVQRRASRLTVGQTQKDGRVVETRYIDKDTMQVSAKINHEKRPKYSIEKVHYAR